MNGSRRLRRLLPAMVVCIAALGGHASSVTAQEGSVRVVVDLATATKQGDISTCPTYSDQLCGYYQGSGLTVNGLEQWTLDLAITSVFNYTAYGTFRVTSTTRLGNFLAGTLYVNVFPSYLTYGSVAMNVTEGGGAYAGYVSVPGPIGSYPGLQPAFHRLDTSVAYLPSTDLPIFAGWLAWGLMPA